MPLLLGLGGSHDGLTEGRSELLVLASLEVLHSLDKVVGDGDTVEDQVLLDDLDGILLGHGGELVEVSPVVVLGVDGFASWKTLLGTLNGSNSSNDSTDSLGPVLVSPSLLEELDAFVESDGGLVLTVDADKEVGEVEGTDVGALEETLEDLGGDLSVVLGVGISPSALLGNWGSLNLLSELHHPGHEGSELLEILIGSFGLSEDLIGVFQEVGSDLWEVLERIFEEIEGCVHLLVIKLG